MNDYKLESVELHITDACTHHCPYCYADAKIGASTKYADFRTIKSIINELKISGVKTVALLGGDPVLHPKFVDIAKYINSAGMQVACMSNTMGTGKFSPEDISKIIYSIDTTIHASTAKEHDEFCRCPGAYDFLMEKLDIYSHLGVIVNIVVNIIPNTYNKIYDIVQNIIRKNVIVTNLLTQRILPYGRAENSTRYDVTADQINIAFSQIEDVVKDFGIGISVEDPYPLCCIDKKYWKYMHGCPEGKTRIALNSEGSVSKCGAVPESYIGNVFETSLLQIWESDEELNSIREGKHLILDECKICDFQERCCGGCPVNCENCNSTGKSYIRSFKGNTNEHISKSESI